MKNILIVMMMVMSCVADDKIGNIVMPSGRAYDDVTVVKATPAWIKVTHKHGWTVLFLDKCGDEIKKRYKYDAAKAKAYKASRDGKLALAVETRAKIKEDAADRKRLAEIKARMEELKEGLADLEKEALAKKLGGIVFSNEGMKIAKISRNYVYVSWKVDVTSYSKDFNHTFDIHLLDDEGFVMKDSLDSVKLIPGAKKTLSGQIMVKLDVWEKCKDIKFIDRGRSY